ncbi:hypothetical protein [Chroococcidiopsis sp. SAG 2025]|uniref:hypothetical protein n=1 Tax=Chroococcidiopsis sp. SAG 2025 TaxID=171389 RepID=UPI00293734F1|nr:hypothetical protein [Chroococcidiopsis sp. SAG 2025]
MNLIEAQWHQLKTHEIAGRIFDNEYDLANAMIEGMENRSQQGDGHWNVLCLNLPSYLSARMHVNRDGNYEQWKANFRYFARNVMMRYKGKISYYIIDNEPDLDYGNGKMSAQECVDMTRIAYETANRN